MSKAYQVLNGDDTLILELDNYYDAKEYIDKMNYRYQTCGFRILEIDKEEEN